MNDYDPKTEPKPAEPTRFRSPKDERLGLVAGDRLFKSPDVPPADSVPPTRRPSTANGALGLLAAYAGLALPDLRPRVELGGHACGRCGSRLGHAPDCADEAIEKWRRHVEHCAKCRRPSTVLDLELLCPRGRRLIEALQRVGTLTRLEEKP